MSTSSLRPGLGLLALLLLSACGSDSGFNENTDFVNPSGAVRFVNMLPDSPQITVLHGLNTTQIQFPVASTIESRFEDKYDWRIAYLNSTDDEVTVARADDQQIKEATLSTFLLYGNLGQASVQIVDTPLIAAADRPAGKATVWFASNITNHSMVDVYLTALDADLSTATPLATVTSGSYTEHFSVDAGTTRQLRFTVAATQTILFDSGVLEIPEQTEDLYALVDDFGPNGASHVNVIRSISTSGSTIRDVSQPALVKVSNFAEQTPIDASLADVDYFGIGRLGDSPFKENINGTLPFVVLNADSDVLEDSTLEVVRGSFQTAYVFENNATDATSVTRSLLIAGSVRPIKDRTLITFLNGSGEVIDLYLLRDGQDLDEVPAFINDIGFASTLNSESRIGNMSFVVRNSGNTETLATLDATLQNDVSYTLIYDTRGELHLLVNQSTSG